MKNHLFNPSGLLVVACGLFLTCTIQAQPATKPADAETDDVKLHTGNETEYKSLFDAVKFDAEQEKAVRAKIAERATTLKQWVESDKGKQLVQLRTDLAEVRNAKQTAKIGPLREQIKPLADEYTEVRRQTRLNILKVLNPDQLKQYVGQSLATRVMPGANSVVLTDAQKASIKSMCEAKASEYLEKSTIDNDVYFRGLDTSVAPMKKTIYETVLTEEQRATIVAKRKQRPATTQSAQ